MESAVESAVCSATIGSATTRESVSDDVGANGAWKSPCRCTYVTTLPPPSSSASPTNRLNLRPRCTGATVAHDGASSSATTIVAADDATAVVTASLSLGIIDPGSGRANRTVASASTCCDLPFGFALTASRRRRCDSSHCPQSLGATQLFSADSNPSAPGQRAEGRFCISRSMMYCKRAGTAPGRNASIAGKSSFFCLKMTLYSASPSHGRSPVSISQPTRPRLYRSDRALAGAPSICSGAI